MKINQAGLYDTQVESKSAIRHTFIERRQQLPAAEKHAAAAALARLFFDAVDLPPDAVVAGYWPVRGEIDVLPLMRELIARGHRVALPHVVAADAPLLFRLWRDDAPMRRGGFGIPEPSDGAEVTPDTVLVPLVAFDSHGHRVGYGGGYYDGTLAHVKPARAIGIAYDVQRYDGAFASEKHDVPLHMIVTDKKIYRF